MGAFAAFAPIVGSVIGGLMSGGDQQQAATQTTSNAPWAALQPYLLGSPGRAATMGSPALPGVGVSSPGGIMGKGLQPRDNESGLEQVARMAQQQQQFMGTPAIAADPGTPAIGGLFPSAAEWFGQAPGATVAPFTPRQQQVMDATFARGMAGSPSVKAAQDMLTATARGDFLNANPYLDAMFGQASRGVTDQFTNAVMPQLASMFSSAGRYGSGAMQDAASRAQLNLGDTLAGMGANIYGTNYANERSRMLQAAGMAPELSSLDYIDLAAAEGVGSQEQAMQQSLRDEQLRKLQAYSNILQGFGGGTSTTSGTQNIPGKPLMGALGGGLLGRSLSDMFPANQGAPLGYANESLGLSGFSGFQPDMGYQASRIGMF